MSVNKGLERMPVEIKLSLYSLFIYLFLLFIPPQFIVRVRNLKFATYLKFAICENTNKINELW